ncbi:L-ascorbate oxidase homolog [Nicotiana tabacum]|uniref:L-ascorbate oxidase homolog n=2 Tax=Nicotiana TaxID=4085 RepID=A0A1S3ZS31_TOBAC|nr:PREDICTED: L-ascorbate oxidase homolog [Nicotiana sylvestris]XP_016467221.1 PREDICTED: L-ascorbate oxidase homolog [Nicotiana tabacum]
MGRAIFLHFLFGTLVCLIASVVRAEDPYVYKTWVVTYGQIAPLGVKQRGILINGQFPGPTLNVVTNDNVLITVINKLDDPLLITWNGVKQRKSSWQDGVLGTNCPIPPNSQWTYKMQMKDQIGTFTYFPSTLMHRAAGGFGGLNILARSVIPVPYPKPFDQFTLLVSDWWKTDNKVLKQRLDQGNSFPFPDALLINGRANSFKFTGMKGYTYLLRVSNVGLTTSINIRIQGHTLRLVEVEGAHTMQEVYESLDIHVGQSMAFLVTLHANPKDYYIVASTRFTKQILTATAILHYQGSNTPASKPLPIGPTYHVHWSMKQARTIRWNLTANAARPNPQGAFHYGTVPVTRTLVLANSAGKINAKRRYAMNKISYINPDTPLKIADFYNIPGVFQLNKIKDNPPPGPIVLGTSVFNFSLHDFTEIVFQNNEKTIQSYHLDGYDFWAVGYGPGQWNPTMRRKYNLVDATSRCTIQVYPKSWSTILVSLDNKGMWNLRSAIWPRRYLGQETYFRVWNTEHSLYTEYDIPPNAILCGKAKH